MKIALIGAIDSQTSQNATAGTEIWTYSFMSELIKRGHNVTLFASSDSKVDAKLISNISSDKLIDTDTGLMSKERVAFFSIDQMIEVVRNQDSFDLVHISAYSSQYYLPFVKLLRKPVIATIHGPSLKREDAEVALPLVKNVNFALISKSFAGDWGHPEKYKIIYNGINLENFSFSNLAKNYYFCMGRIAPEKGISDAVLFATKSGQKLYIAGPITKPTYFEESIKPHLNSKIKYVGELNFNEKMKYYKSALAFLMPIKWPEPFGLVAVESMACGTPVIAYNRGALPEIITSGQDGYLVEPDSIDGLIEATKKIGLIDRKNCRLAVETKFSISSMTDSYIKYYEDILAGR